MGNWRWPTWAILVWTIGGFFLIGVLASNTAAGRANDYNEAGREFSGVTWAWIIGIIVLGVTWQRTKPKGRCPRCGSAVDPRAVACTKCGYNPSLQPPVAFGQCPRCGQPVPMNAPACPTCGYFPGQPIVPPQPPYPPAPPAPPAY